jgi:trigger factor
MARILKSEITKDLKYVVDLLAEKKEYHLYQARVLEQLLKNVEIKGFRKGKAPRELALKQVDPNKLQSTLLQESVEKFYGDLRPEIEKEIAEKKRVAILGTARLEDEEEFTKETDEGFQFRISILLLADVDVAPISKLELKAPTADQIPGRETFDEYFAKESKALVASFNNYKPTKSKIKDDSRIVADITEQLIPDKKDKNSKQEEPKESKNATINLGENRFPQEFEQNLIGLKAGEEKEFDLKLEITGQGEQKFHFKIKIVEVLEAEFETVEEILENSKDAKKQFGTPEDFKNLVKKVYDQETEQLLKNLKRRQIIEEVVKVVPKFQLPQSSFEAEVERILQVLNSRTLEAKISLKDAFAASGLPGSEDKIKSDSDVKPKIEEYVTTEFKLVEILRYVYYTLVEPKIEDKEVQEFKEAIEANPSKYNVSSAEIANGKAIDVAYDRLLREKAFNWIAGQVKFVSDKPKTKTASKKESEETEVKKPKTTAKKSTSK